MHFYYILLCFSLRNLFILFYYWGKQPFSLRPGTLLVSKNPHQPDISFFKLYILILFNCYIESCAEISVNLKKNSFYLMYH